jgi:hypothetical protein
MIAPALKTTWRAGGPRPESRPRLNCQIASTLAERRQACRLVYQSYLTKGLIEPNQFGMRVTPWHLLPTTSTFVALEAGRVIGTVTLIGDAGLGLPMESIYPAEVEAARLAGLYVGEVSCLATRDTDFKEFLPIFVSLTRLMAQHARAHGMDQFLIAIHPKHARFYEKFMGFEQIGSLTEYPSVNNAPAVACCLDFARIDRYRPACWERFFGTPLPAADLAPQPMSDEELDYFGPMTELAEHQLLVCA